MTPPGEEMKLVAVIRSEAKRHAEEADRMSNEYHGSRSRRTPLPWMIQQERERASYLTQAAALIEQLVGDRDRAEADVAFLLLRAGAAGSVSFTRDRWTGMSSNAIVAVAFGGELRTLPSDVSDYLACVRTVRRLPKHRKTPAVWEALRKGREAVRAKYPRKARAFLDSLGER